MFRNYKVVTGRNSPDERGEPLYIFQYDADDDEETKSVQEHAQTLADQWVHARRHIKTITAAGKIRHEQGESPNAEAWVSDAFEELDEPERVWVLIESGERTTAPISVHDTEEEAIRAAIRWAREMDPDEPAAGNLGSYHEGDYGDDHYYAPGAPAEEIGLDPTKDDRFLAMYYKVEPAAKGIQNG